MKSFTAFVALAAPTLTAAQWWAGAPSCAHSCLSSVYWGTATPTDVWAWPTQTAYCDSGAASRASTCLTSACSLTTTAASSYSSLSSSLCSAWSSCTAGGNTGVHTVTYPGGSVTWGIPGGTWSTTRAPSTTAAPTATHAARGEPWDNWDSWAESKWVSDWASAWAGSVTWGGGVVTVTGCNWDGSPWYVGPGSGWNQVGGFDGWIGWGAGWSYGPTATTTVTVTTTDGSGHSTTYTGVATVKAAVSGTVTTTQTDLPAQAAVATGSGATATAAATTNTPKPTSNAAARVAPAAEGSVVLSMMGFALATVVAIACML